MNRRLFLNHTTGIFFVLLFPGVQLSASAQQSLNITKVDSQKVLELIRAQKKLEVLNRIKEDFENGRTIEVNGWILSNTEHTLLGLGGE